MTEDQRDHFSRFNDYEGTPAAFMDFLNTLEQLEIGEDQNLIEDALLVAIETRDKGLSLKLIDLGARGDVFEDGMTALHYAAESDFAIIVSKIIEERVRPDINEEEHGITPLHCAASRDSLATIIALRNAGANLDAKDKSGFTALHYAAQNKKIEAMGLLATFRANLNIIDNDGFTARDILEAEIERTRGPEDMEVQVPGPAATEGDMEGPQGPAPAAAPDRWWEAPLVAGAGVVAHPALPIEEGGRWQAAPMAAPEGGVVGGGRGVVGEGVGVPPPGGE